jgi:N-acetylated-alpha-linked acidic dipeptidase
MRIRLLPLFILSIGIGLSPTVLTAQTAPIRGFPADALAERARIEALLRATPDPDLLREYLLVMTEEPHHAGSPAARAVAEYALEKFRSWGLETEMEEFEAYMPFPTTRRVELLAPERYVARLEEPELAEDKDSGDQGRLPTYNAYSADGDVTGELVFVNYGLPEDYARLEEMGVDVRGKVVIAKYGRSWRGIKPKVAAEHGAIATLMYSDPEDDGYYVDDDYPRGPMRPEWGVQMGSVMDMPTYPGDPLTPAWGSKAGGRKLDPSEATTLMQIPVLPLAWGDALPLLRALGGKVAPNEDWKGALPITYHVGPGPARVRVHLEFDWQNRTLYNPVARIPGTTDAEQLVIHGNHHDAWVNGANDPTSGAVALMETARAFSQLLDTGWRPKRTIVFALWDGEEWGLLGSTEWAEHHRDNLDRNAVLYFNSDSYSRGWFGGGGSHTLQTFVEQIARDITDPRTGKSALEAGVDRALENARTAADSARLRERGYAISALGSGSDYTVFIDHLTVASLNLGHGGGQDAGVYHSAYDSFDFYARFYDPDFEYGKAQAGAFATGLVRMADAPILPFSFTDAAATYERYVDELKTLVSDSLGAGAVHLAPVEQAVARLADAGNAFDVVFDRAMSQGSRWLTSRSNALKAINREIYLTERDLATDRGLPQREWFRHTIYAPGFYTGYGVKTMPGIREASELRDADQANSEAAVVAAAIDRMAQRVEGVVRDLDALVAGRASTNQ